MEVAVNRIEERCLRELVRQIDFSTRQQSITLKYNTIKRKGLRQFIRSIQSALRSEFHVTAVGETFEWAVFSAVEWGAPTQWAKPDVTLLARRLRRRGSFTSLAMQELCFGDGPVSRMLRECADRRSIAMPSEQFVGTDSVRFAREFLQGPCHIGEDEFRGLDEPEVIHLVELAFALRPIERLTRGRHHQWEANVSARLLESLAYTGDGRLEGLAERIYDAGIQLHGTAYGTIDEALQRRVVTDYKSGCAPNFSLIIELIASDEELAHEFEAGELPLHYDEFEVPFFNELEGYELYANGGIDLFYYEQMYSLNPALTEENRRWEERLARHPAARGFVRAEDGKPFNRYLLDLDLTDPALACLELSGSRLRIPYIPTYEAVFYRIDTAGNAVPCESNDNAYRFDDDMPREGLEAYYYLGKQWWSPYATRRDLLYAGPTNYLGGIPRWIQEPQWLDCPGCDGRMTFLAHLDNCVGWPIGGDQDAYVHICTDCLIAGVVMQQS